MKLVTYDGKAPGIGEMLDMTIANGGNTISMPRLDDTGRCGLLAAGIGELAVPMAKTLMRAMFIAGIEFADDEVAKHKIQIGGMESADSIFMYLDQAPRDFVVITVRAPEGPQVFIFACVRPLATRAAITALERGGMVIPVPDGYFSN